VPPDDTSGRTGACSCAGAQHVDGLTEVAALDQQADQQKDSAAERDIEPEPVCPPPLSWRGQDKS
jgi:hypothetical protein